MKNEAVLTGSRVYGFPKSDSDWDLAVLINGNDWRVCEMLKAFQGFKFVRNGQTLNIIWCFTEEELERWRRAKEECLRLSPIPRDTAIAVCQAFGIVNGRSGVDTCQES